MAAACVAAPAFVSQAVCNCGGYHLSCRLRDMEQHDALLNITKDFGKKNTKLAARGMSDTSTAASESDASPAAMDLQPQGVPSAVVLGSGKCNCGGYHRGCCDRAPVKRSVAPAQPPPSQPAANGIPSSAVIGYVKCNCGGYHRACRRELGEEVLAPPVAAAPVAFEGVLSSVVTGAGDCKCGGYHRACRREQQDPPQLPEIPVPSPVGFDGISSSIVNGPGCLCGGYHRQCQPRAPKPHCRPAAPQVPGPAAGVLSRYIASGMAAWQWR